MKYHDTIIAQATPFGRGSVGILRISGLKAREVAEAVLGKLPKPRYADYLSFKDIDGSILDRGIALWFAKPNSFTGEDVLELQGHGGPVVLDLLLKRILTLPGLRIANPGEFSERAFLNKKLDLVQTEAIFDLINASSEQAARSAMSSLQGTFSIYINRLVEALIHLRTHVEAAIDFSEEEIDFSSSGEILVQLNSLLKNLNEARTAAKQGCLLQEGIKIVIAGHPNSGKSSLLNALAGREVAIVTDIAGTTRDILHEYIHIDGVPLHIIDTAGLRNTIDTVELIGIERSCREIEQADQVLFVVDSTTTNSIHPLEIWPDFIIHFPDKLPITLIRNKVDLTGEKFGISNTDSYSIVRLSTRTGEGVDELRAHLKKRIGFNSSSEGKFLARRRHLYALDKAEQHLKKCKTHLINMWASELLAEELRLAQNSLNEITGEFTSDQLLEEIFSSFCIGK